uniref:Uncharacterized protein n=1 Tax=Eutreptiella gymnastica TaxID=73025 RepID=A0A7S1IDK0_9EUGL
MNMSDNGMGDEAGFSIADPLESRNQTLTYLDISGTGISTITICALAQTLKRNCTLRSLILDTNRITQLPEPQDLANAVFNDHDDLVADPEEGIISDDSEEETEEPASEGGEQDSDMEEEEAGGYVPAPTQANGAVILPEDAAEHAIDVITNRYHRLEGMEALRDVLHTNSSLTELSVANCALDDPSFKILADGLLQGNNASLRRLSIERTDVLGEKGSLMVKGLIIESRALEDLNLGGTNPLVAERAILALEQTTRLKCLDLSRCELGEDMVTMLYDSLAKNAQCPLERLSLAGNTINSSSLKWMEQILALPHLPLQALDLGSTMDMAQWPEQGCLAMRRFGAAVAASPRLKRCGFSGNGLGDAAAAVLAAELKAATTLEDLDITRNRIGIPIPTLFEGVHRSSGGRVWVASHPQTPAA